MRNVKNSNQLYIFDLWEFLTSKRRQMLEAGWPGLFQKHILLLLPVGNIAKHFGSDLGRPTIELYAMLGALILQQTFDLTDVQTVEQFCFNTQWHFALNITEESDAAKYPSKKTLWKNRNIVATNNLEDDIFNIDTQQLAQVFKVDIEKQRMDSVHIKSNMRPPGRIGIFSESIHTFDKDNPVEIKAPKQIASDSLQNSSDLDATYSGHKRQGCQVQIMKTFCDDQDKKEKSLNLITHVEVEPAHKSDANALVSAIDAVEE